MVEKVKVRKEPALTEAKPAKMMIQKKVAEDDEDESEPLLTLAPATTDSLEVRQPPQRNLAKKRVTGARAAKPT